MRLESLDFSNVTYCVWTPDTPTPLAVAPSSCSALKACCDLAISCFFSTLSSSKNFQDARTDYSILFIGFFSVVFSPLLELFWVYLSKAPFGRLRHNKFHSSFTRAYQSRPIGFITVSSNSTGSLPFSSPNWAANSWFSFVLFSIADFICN